MRASVHNILDIGFEANRFPMHSLVMGFITWNQSTVHVYRSISLECDCECHPQCIPFKVWKKSLLEPVKMSNATSQVLWTQFATQYHSYNYLVDGLYGGSNAHE